MDRTQKLKNLRQRYAKKTHSPKPIPKPVQGLPGLDGINGKDGKDGQRGKPGTFGKRGKIGKPGKDGQTGKPGLIWRGSWKAGDNYDFGDVVENLGSSFVCVLKHESTNDNMPVLLPKNSYWDIAAKKGFDGAGGISGTPGLPGMQGIAGEGIASGGMTGQILTKQSNADFDTDWETINAGLEIGEEIVSGSAKSILFIDGSGNLAQDANFTYTQSAGRIDINGAVRFGRSAYFIGNTSNGFVINNNADTLNLVQFYPSGGGAIGQDYANNGSDPGFNNFIVEGNIGIGNVTTTARFHLPAGAAGAGEAPIKLTAGTVLTTPEIGTIEFTDDGTSGHLYITLNIAGVLTRKLIV